jgi:alcohol dehydrogenase
VPSWHYPGGYVESVIAPVTALARIPDELSFTAALQALGGAEVVLTI